MALVVLGVAAAAALFGIAVVGSVVRRVVSFLVFAAVAILIVSLVVKGDPFGVDLDFLRKPIEEKVREYDEHLRLPDGLQGTPDPEIGQLDVPAVQVEQSGTPGGQPEPLDREPEWPRGLGKLDLSGRGFE